MVLTTSTTTVTLSASVSSDSGSATNALTTTFTPPAQCTDTAHMFTMLSSPEYYVWANEPMPVSSSTVSSCYPPEWISAYNTASSHSSQVPAMSPLVCPLSWTTIMTAPGNYIACCPHNFTGAYPASTVDGYRPMYGGTCYSDASVGQTISVTKYNDKSIVAFSAWPVTVTSAQVYAHPIDGYAMQHVEQTVYVTASNASQPTGIPTPSPSSSNKLSGGVIAGIVIGVLGGIAVLAALLWFLRRRKKSNLPSEVQDAATTVTEDSTNSKTLHEIHSNERLELPVSKIDAIGYGELQGSDEPTELDVNTLPAELEAGHWKPDDKPPL